MSLFSWSLGSFRYSRTGYLSFQADVDVKNRLTLIRSQIDCDESKQSDYPLGGIQPYDPHTSFYKFLF